MMMMSCVSISSSVTRGAISVGSSSSLCFGTPKLFNSARVAVNGRRRNKGLSCNAMFGLGVPELVVIAGVAALVFGPKKLPEVGRSIGKTVKSFQQVTQIITTVRGKLMKWEDDYLLDFGIHFCTLLLLRMVIIIIFDK